MRARSEQPIDLNDLSFFTWVVDHGGFSQAARALGLQKAKLSRRIAQLEERLGVRLIQRTTRSFSVTEAGQDYYQHCRAMLVEAEAAERSIALRLSEPCGTVRIACPISLLHARVDEMIIEFMAIHPHVRVLLEATNRRIDVVAEGFDLAIRVRPPPLQDSDLVVRVLADHGWTIAANPGLIEKVGLPLAPGDLSELPTLDLESSSGTHAWTLFSDAGDSVEVSHTPRLCTDDMSTLVKSAVNGLGFIMLPSLVVTDEIRNGRLLPVLGEWRGRAGVLHALYPSRRGLLPSVRSLIDHLVSGFEAMDEL